MEAHVHHQEGDNARLHSGEGEEEHNQKKSVLKKVKDKAKKIKNTIKKHGGHGHGHGDEHDEDEEDEEDAPEVHGAPMYESAFISGTNLPKQTGLDLEKPAGLPEDTYNPSAKNELVYPDAGYGRGLTDISGASDDRYTPNVRNDATSGGGGVSNYPGLAVDTYNPSAKNELVYPDAGYGRGRTDISGASDDRDTPNVTSGSGGVANAPGLAEDMFHRNVRNEVYPDIAGAGTKSRTPGLGKKEYELGSSPVEAAELNQSGPYAAMDVEEARVAEPRLSIGPPVGLVKDPNRPGEIPRSNYQTKVVDPTGQGGEEAEVAPLVQRLDNLHVAESYAGSHGQFAPQSTPTGDQFSRESDPVKSSETASKSSDPANPESMPKDTIAGKISAAASAIACKAVSAKNVVAENLAEAGNAISGGTEHERGDTATDKGVSVKEYLAEKFSPGEEDKALSEVITDAIHKKTEGMRRAGEERPPIGAAHSVGERDATGGGSKNSGTGVVDRVKGAVSSWLGMGGEAQHSLHQEHGSALSGGGRELSKEEDSSKQPA